MQVYRWDARQNAHAWEIHNYQCTIYPQCKYMCGINGKYINKSNLHKLSMPYLTFIYKTKQMHMSSSNHRVNLKKWSAMQFNTKGMKSMWMKWSSVTDHPDTLTCSARLNRGRGSRSNEISTRTSQITESSEVRSTILLAAFKRTRDRTYAFSEQEIWYR